jgi:putative ABC transport system permease protein
MKLRYVFKTAVSGLRTHGGRSALTILGIVIGVMAIILIMAIGKGAQNLILTQVEGMGSKTIIVIPGREPKGPTDPSIVEAILSDSLKDRDFKALQNKANVPGLDKIMPIVFGPATAVYESNTYRTTIIGSSDMIADIFDLQPAEGNFFTAEDIKGLADVAVIGSKVKTQLFGQSPALGERIKIKGRTVRIVGILPEKGQVSLFNFDEIVLIPYTTAQQYIFGIKYFNRFIIEAKTEEIIPSTINDITLTLRNLHGITDPAKDDFYITSQADIVKRLDVITSILTLLLTSVAAISLLVGGIGIMNIMLVNVTERTREIGLRKALGATESDIMTQFLMEAIILTALGGLLGIAIGVGIAWLIAFGFRYFGGINWVFVFPVSAVLIGVGVSAAIGLVFGLYPAGQAAKKSPMEALRYE